MAAGLTPYVEGPVNAQASNQPLLTVDADPCQPASRGVTVCNIDPDLIVSLGRHLQAGGSAQSVLRVNVVRTGAPIGEDLPDVFGRYTVFEDGIQFTPHFPFERGVSYTASFDPRPLGRPELSDVLTLEFSLPREKSPLPTKVKHIFPSSDCLPENLLRFYVCFSNPMQRGQVRAEISLLGPNGESQHPTHFIVRPSNSGTGACGVYICTSHKARSQEIAETKRKRGVGPNRELGPPLETVRSTRWQWVRG
jgi:hypothetical protein